MGQVRESRQRVHADNMADAGTNTYDQDFALATASSGQEALLEIEEALNRIKRGATEFAKPLESQSRPLGLRRFRGRDSQRRPNAKKLEAENAVDRARLGDRRDLPRSSEPSPDDKDAEGMEG